MGLFWSMKPTLDMRKGTRLMKQDVNTPLVTRMYVHDGHLTAPDPRHVSAQALATGEMRRWYMDPQVKRVEVIQDGVRGTLFIPPGKIRSLGHEGQGQPGQVREPSLYHQVRLDPWVRVKVNQDGVKGMLFIPPGKIRSLGHEGQGQPRRGQGTLFIPPGEIRSLVREGQGQLGQGQGTLFIPPDKIRS